MREILGVVRRAIPGHGRLLLVEEVVAPPNQPAGKLVDLLMLAVGGRGRTERQWHALLAEGGFQLSGSDPATAPASWKPYRGNPPCRGRADPAYDASERPDPRP